MQLLEPVVLPARRLGLDGADLGQERRVFECALGRCREADVGIVDDRLDEGRIELGLLDPEIGLGSLRLVALDPLQRVEEHLERLRIVVVELRGRIEQGGRDAAAHDVVGAQHLADLRILQRLLLIRRIGEMGGDGRRSRQQRLGCVRMRQVDGEIIERAGLSFGGALKKP